MALAQCASRALVALCAGGVARLPGLGDGWRGGARRLGGMGGDARRCCRVDGETSLVKQGSWSLGHRREERRRQRHGVAWPA
jgi:hypothetical protein